MKKYFPYLLASLIILTASAVSAQFEGYASMTAGYNNNPLYNFQKLGDQIKQGYLELKYSKEYQKSALNFSYVSGLMLFNNLADRNYYEQTLAASYVFKYPKSSSIEPPKIIKPKPAEGDSSGDEEAEIDSTGITVEDADSDASEKDEESVFNSLVIGASVNSRFDKNIFKEFDNHGFAFNMRYNHETNPDFNYSISNTVSLRNYTYISGLSNITDLLSIEAGAKNGSKFSYGAILSGGFKYYTETFYDTTQFEQTRTFNTKSQGKGKPGSVTASSKKILVTPQSNGTYQLAMGFYTKKEWDNGSFGSNFIYRYNVRSENRYLAQYVNTSFLSEDIYNDFFSYEGPEAVLKYSQILTAKIKLDLELQVQYKKFKAPALNLIGEQTAGNRNDLRSSAEATLSRYFNLSDNFGFDITISGGVLRNESNDEYNDFSSYFLSAGIGIGL